MDTKLKKYKNIKSNKILINILVIIILLVSSLGVIKSYKNIDNTKIDENCLNKKEVATYFTSNYYNLYWNMKKNTEGIHNPSELFLNEKDIDIYLKDIDSTVKKDDVKNDFNRAFFEHEDEFDYNEIIKYNVYNKSNKKTYANEDKDLKYIREYDLDKKNNDKINELKQKYLLFATVDFNNNGEATIKSLHGADKNNYQELENYNNTINSEITSDNYFNKYSDDYMNYSLSPIKDTVITIGITKNDAKTVFKNMYFYEYSDYLSNIISGSKIDSYRQIVGYSVSIMIIFAILGLILPNSIRNNILGMDKITRIPIEILFIIASIILAFFIAFNPLIFVNSTIEDILKYELLDVLPITNGISEIIIVIINLLYWMLLFAMLFMLGIYIRNMLFSKEDRKTIFRSSIIVKLIKWMKKQIKAFLNWINKLDLKDGREKLILSCLAINFILIVICSIMWGFGIILAVIYTIVLYKLIKKKTAKVFDDYDKLEKITKDIADGDFKEISDEDLGIFNPIKENLQNIKVGFSNAVNEEVKSQKMKTELITNVSHDLKTPLTSIITYVDLLKKEDITEEERKKYLETIEKKSNRLKFLIEDLFEVSKATSGNITMNLMKVDVVSLIKQTIVELEDKLNASHLKIKTDFPSEKVILELDNMRTFRIFSNLISNISKYSMPYTRVYISVKKEEETTEIEFKNISAEELNCNVENLTERFVRGDKSRNTEGSGLGLAIVKSFTELQGGKINISSDGDLFKVNLTFKNK